MSPRHCLSTVGYSSELMMLRSQSLWSLCSDGSVGNLGGKIDKYNLEY